MRQRGSPPPGMVRIAHVAWLSEVGGGELFLLDLVRHVDRARFSQGVYCIGPGGEPARQAAGAGHTLHRFPRSGRAGLGTVLRLATALRRARPDVVQTHGEAGVFWGVPAARLARVPAIGSLLYQNRPTARHKMAALRALLPLASVVVAGSHDVRRFLATGLGVSYARSLPIPCGIDPEPFGRAARYAERTARRPVILTVGRLVAEKGHATLLEAFRSVSLRLDAELWIVGDGPLRGDLAALADRLELGERVRFLSTVYPTADVLAQADLFAFPSLVEPQGLAVLEAFAAGVPVVASRTGGIVEMVEHGITGVLVAPGDPEALAHALAALLADPLRREALAAAASRRVAEFDIRRIAGSYERLWAALARGVVPTETAAPPGMIAT